MNRRNFGRVIRRIKAHPELWAQDIPPSAAVNEVLSRNSRKWDCNTPYCFLGHAEYLRTNGQYIRVPRYQATVMSPSLQKWLGLNNSELLRVFDSGNSLSDFERWHKDGKVPTDE